MAQQTFGSGQGPFGGKKQKPWSQTPAGRAAIAEGRREQAAADAERARPAREAAQARRTAKIAGNVFGNGIFDVRLGNVQLGRPIPRVPGQKPGKGKKPSVGSKIPPGYLGSEANRSAIRAAQRRAGGSPSTTSTRSSGGRRSGGGGGGGGATASTRPPKATTPSTTAAGGTGSTTEDDDSLDEINVDTLYSPAFRYLDKQKSVIEEQNKANIADNAAFKAWQDEQRTKSETALGGALKDIGQQNADAQKNIQDNAVKYTNDALQNLAGGSSDIQRLAGLEAAAGQNVLAGQSAAANTANAGTQRASIAQYQADQRNVDLARQKNMAASTAAQFYKAQSDLGTQRAGLNEKLAAAKLSEKQSLRTAKADAKTQAFLNSIATGKLDVQKANAETARYSAQAKAEYQKEMARIGRMRVSQSEKDRLTRIAVAKLNNSGKAANQAGVAYGKASDAVTNLRDQAVASYGGFDKMPTHEQGQLIQNAITQLRRRTPNLTRDEANEILTQNFGNRYASQDALLALVVKNFK